MVDTFINMWKKDGSLSSGFTGLFIQNCKSIRSVAAAIKHRFIVKLIDITASQNAKYKSISIATIINIDFLISLIN